MAPAANAEADPMISLHAERLTIERRRIVGDTVRATTVTREREHIVDEELHEERVEIDRVAIGRLIETAPPVRQEGEVTIIPVVEEILVIERKLLLKEEIRVRQVRTTRHHHETVKLRAQEAIITRTKAAPSAVSDGRELPTPDSKPSI